MDMDAWITGHGKVWITTHRSPPPAFSLLGFISDHPSCSHFLNPCDQDESITRKITWRLSQIS
jgi:hypothetical protein